jgi:hypothetical protein
MLTLSEGLSSKIIYIYIEFDKHRHRIAPVNLCSLGTYRHIIARNEHLDFYPNK